MIFVNSVLFLIFCLTSLYFLFNEGRMIDNPFVKGKKYFATGPQIFLIFTMATGMFMLGDYSSIRLSVWIAYMFLGSIIANGKIKFNLVLVCFALYVSYMLVSLFFITASRGFGFRVIAKYIYPFFVLLFVNKATNSEFVVYSGIKYIFMVAILAELVNIGYLPFLYGSFWGAATMADHLVIAIVIALGLYYITSKRKFLYLILFFGAFPFIATIRTGIIAMVASLSVFFLFKYKWRAVPFIALVAVLGFLSILYVPNIRNKMFRKQMTADEIMENRETLTMDDIDTNGRQAMWDWSLENFYENNKVFGSGIGNLQYVFYETKHPFQPIRIVHNDYIQILCDMGLVGLFLFISISFSMIIHTFFIYNDKRNNEMIRLCAIVAGSSIVGIMATSYTDNAVNYTLATYSYPFAFYGMALGLRQKYRR